MNKEIIVSIVIPIYNMELFLPRCMEALLTQEKLDNIEIILVDDGSTDRSGELCDFYCTQYSDLVRTIHKENGGLSSARNAGIKIAIGKYITFPDPDDWVEPNYISKLLEFQQHYKFDLICFGYYVDYENQCALANLGQRTIQMTAEEAQESLLKCSGIGGFAWNKLYNTEIIRRHCLRFLDDVGTTEDLDFAFRYLSYCLDVIFEPEVRLCHYFQREGAATHGGFSLKKFEAIHTYEKIIETAADRTDLVNLSKAAICNMSINLLCLYMKDEYNDKKVWKSLRKYIADYLMVYLTCNQYGIGRKVQALLAYISPRVYITLKKLVTK